MMMKKFNIFLLLIIFLAVSAGSVSAFESTSTSFQLHASDVENGTGRSSSTSFINQDALGQTGSGFSSSTDFNDYSGILYWLFASNQPPALEQLHSRWRNDDGGESSASYINATDTILMNSVYIGDRIRLRILISNNGAGPANNYNYRLEYAPQGGNCASASPWTKVPDTTTSEPWQMGGASNVADNTTTTNSAGIADPGGKTFHAGKVRTSTADLGTVTISQAQFSEIEYSIKSTTNITPAQLYCFRVTNVGSTTNFTYTNYPQISVMGITYRPQGGGSTGSIESSTSPNSQTTGGSTGGGTTTTQCNDGVDNNSNLLIDSADPNCHAGGNLSNPYVPTWDSESTPPGGSNGGGTPGSGSSGGDIGFKYNNSLLAQVFSAGQNNFNLLNFLKGGLGFITFPLMLVFKKK